MKELRMKLPFTEPCGNGLQRFHNWDGTQLSAKRERKREGMCMRGIEAEGKEREQKTARSRGQRHTLLHNTSCKDTEREAYSALSGL